MCIYVFFSHVILQTIHANTIVLLSLSHFAAVHWYVVSDTGYRPMSEAAVALGYGKSITVTV